MADTSRNKVTAATLESLNAALQKQADFYTTIGEKKKAAAMLDDMAANRQKVLNELYLEQVKAQEKGGDLSNKKLKLLEDLEKQQKEYNEKLKKENELLEKGIKSRQRHVDLAKALGAQLAIGWKYLQDSDKVIRTTTLNLGLSGTKAVQMRNAFEKSAGYVTRMGGSLADIQAVMEGYADETGRARVMTAEMVKDITSIGKGTGLGIEQATKLGAQFELMGFDAKSTMDYVQGVVDTSERMGVNTTKVLKNVNDNFKRLNTYTFQQGVKGFAQMAMYAEKFKMDITQALNAADISRTLEGAIDLAANLQVMGGEFAKTDPFEMLFLSRNDPAKFTEKIADMTKGVVSFRKMSDGTFEKFISPADRDRLANVAKSMGMEASELTVIAERQAEIQKMRQQMGGMGLSDQQKQLIEGAAIFDKKSGKFQVELAGTMRDISTLTKDQAESFAKESVSLKDRAEQAMTFDETFKATIETLKSALLPILRGINVILKPLSNIATFFSKIAGTEGGWAKAGAILLGAAAAWKGASILFNMGVERYIKGGLAKTFSKGASGSGGGGFGGSGGGTATGTGSKYFTKAGSIRKGAGGLAAGQGMKSLGAGAGIGAAGAGVGAGFMMATKGIGDLAQAIKDVDVDKLKAMNGTIAILGGTMVGILVPAMFAMGAAGPFAALGLVAIGAAAVGVGFGIKLATEGVGKMAYGLAELNKSGGGAGKQLLGVAAGVGAITLAMGMGGVATMFAFNNSLARMAKNSSGIEKVGSAFASIQTVLSGSKEDFLAVESAIKSISNSNIKGGGLFAELSNLLSKPLQVEFAKGSVSLTNDITLNLDGQRFMQKAYDVNIAVQKHEALKHGKA